MNQKLAQLFKEISEINPPASLEGRVLARICQEIDRQAKRYRLFFWMGFSATVISSVVAIIYAGSALAQSDFWRLLSLLFTDAEVVLRDWQIFSLSLLETFPAISLAIILVPVTFVCFSFWFYASVRTASHYHCATS